MTTITNPLTLTEPIVRELRASFLAKGRAELVVKFDELAHSKSGRRRWLVARSTLFIECGTECSEPVQVSDLHTAKIPGYAKHPFHRKDGGYASDFKSKVGIRIEDLLLVELRALGLYLCGFDEDEAGDLHISVGENIPTHQLSDSEGTGVLRCSTCGVFCVAREDEE